MAVMDDDEFDKFLFEKWEADLNEVFDEFNTLAEARISDGTVVPAMVAALIQVARHTAHRHEVSVGKGFFDACVAEILNGGDGLHVNRKPDDRS